MNIVITGASKGMGKAMAMKFATVKNNIFICARNENELAETADEIEKNYKGSSVKYFATDLSDMASSQKFADWILSQNIEVDILINNAGVFPVVEEIQNFPTDAFDYMVKNNMRSAFLMTKFAMPELQKTRGNVVNAGSESGLIGLGENAVYGGTKGWMHAFTRGIAAEQARHGVRANCVCPGAIDTAWTHKEKGPMTKKHEQMILDGTPLGRRGTPDEIAHAYLFLASEEASYVTGALFSVDGGITIGKGAIGAEADKVTKKEPTSELNLKHGKEGATDMLRGTQTNLE